VRRELLDQTFFWTANDLDNKLQDYRHCFNEHRCHSGRNGATPLKSNRATVIDINSYRWKKHCRGLFQLPIAV
jgi:putative transposase